MLVDNKGRELIIQPVTIPKHDTHGLELGPDAAPGCSPDFARSLLRFFAVDPIVGMSELLP